VAERHQVVVIGGGFGGLSVTKALARADVDIILVDRTNHHLFQPLLYQVATGILSEGVITPALLPTRPRARGGAGRSSSVRAALRLIWVHYGTLVVAGGATHARGVMKKQKNVRSHPCFKTGRPRHQRPSTPGRTDLNPQSHTIVQEPGEPATQRREPNTPTP